MKEDKKLPEYVSMNPPGSEYLCCLRLRGSSYYRDGGDWEVGYRWEDGKLYSVSSENNANDKQLYPCTKEEYIESNGSYSQVD